MVFEVVESVGRSSVDVLLLDFCQGGYFLSSPLWDGKT